MIIVPYDHARMRATTKTILKLHGMNPKLVDDLPKFGLVAFDKDGLPLAMGFLRDVEGNYALFDSYLSNPEAPASLRHYALDRITAKLIKLAKPRKLIALSSVPEIIERSVRHGFIELPYKASMYNGQ